MDRKIMKKKMEKSMRASFDSGFQSDEAGGSGHFWIATSFKTKGHLML